MKIFEVDTSMLSGPAHIPAVHSQELGKILLFKALNDLCLRLPEWLDVAPDQGQYIDVAPHSRMFKVDPVEAVSLFHDNGPLNDIFQLPHVARIRVADE